VISAATMIYLLFSGALLQFSGRFISSSRQHYLAFVAIFILLVGMLPQLRLAQVSPGIVFHLGIIMLALQLSAYYSGTQKISAHLYGLIVYIAGLVLLPLSHPFFIQLSLTRFAIMGGTWLLILELERTVTLGSYKLSRVERNLLWVWFITAVAGLWDQHVELLPDLFFLLLLIVHLEQRWPKLRVPAPLIALYGLIITWHAHYTLSGIPGHSVGNSMSFPPNDQQLVLMVTVMVGLLIFGLRSPSVTRQFLYLFLAQEVIMLGGGLDNFFHPNGELIGLQRMLLFVSLVGLFVMIESSNYRGLDKPHLQGLLGERTRFSSGVILVALFFACYPLVYLGGKSMGSQILLLGISLVSIAWAINLIGILWTSVEREYRILRPSLSIWATVVFTILWSAVVIIELVTREVVG